MESNMKKSFIVLIVFVSFFSIFPSDISQAVNLQRIENSLCPENLKALARCYPTVKFEPEFDLEEKDWKITLTMNEFENRSDKPERKKQTVLYWADGRMLPKEELPRKNDYWVLQYKYENVLRDPKEYSEEEVSWLRNFGSASNRRSQAGSPMFFFDFIYSASSQAELEEHIVQTSFLGKRTRIHERILPQVKNVEKQILSLCETDEKVRQFADELKSADAYYWRVIAGTSRKSFHSYGISIDVLPKALRGKAIYWSWEKDRRGDGWMLTPLEERWTPGEKVIKIFEDNGFIWGGNWVIFDNMHFEYHPELTQPVRTPARARE